MRLVDKYKKVCYNSTIKIKPRNEAGEKEVEYDFHRYSENKRRSFWSFVQRQKRVEELARKEENVLQPIRVHRSRALIPYI